MEVRLEGNSLWVASHDHTKRTSRIVDMHGEQGDKIWDKYDEVQIDSMLDRPDVSKELLEDP